MHNTQIREWCSVSRKTKRHYTREPSTKYLLGMPLDELFFEDEVLDFMAVARRRIIATFHHATEPTPRFRPGQGMKRERGTDNYIVGVGCRQSDLARHVLEKMGRPFLSEDQLPSGVLEMPPHYIKAILQRARYDIMLAQINVMCPVSPRSATKRRTSNEVWYDELRGVWQICQSSIDEHVLSRRTARSALKVDNRNYHGRVRSQSKARGVPEGVSVSFA